MDIEKALRAREHLQQREQLIGDRITAFEALDELQALNMPH